MTPKAGWTVKCTKRKASTPLESMPKRTRLSTSSANSTASTGKRKQTILTQISWDLSRSASLGEEDMVPIDPPEQRAHSEEAGAHSKVIRAGPVSKKKTQKSTSTQIDFLERARLRSEVMDEAGLVEEPTGQGPMIPQLDGGHMSPRKQRLDKGIASAASTGNTGRKRKASDPPSTLAADGVKKRLRRRTKVLSDPDQNYEYFQDSLAPSSAGSAPLPAAVDVRPVPRLEIQDSTEIGEDRENIPPQRKTFLMDAATPTKREIPSSQSPESLPPTVKKGETVDLTTPEKPARRTPLGVRSGNARALRSASRTKKVVERFATSPSPKKRNTSGLKLPPKDQNVVQQRVEDSQTNIWSLLPTSSPGSKKRSPDLPIPAPTADDTVMDMPEIPATSQVDDAAHVMSSPPMLEVPANFGSLDKLPPIVDQSKHSTSQVLPVETATVVEDFAYAMLQHDSPAPVVEYGQPLEQTNIVREATEDDIFGSPVKNDTQFNTELNRRIPTSPILPTDPLTSSHFAYTDDTIRLSYSSSEEDEAVVETSLPPPRLVAQFSTVHTETQQVPLNDRSSPTLPPQRAPTQPSIHPASLPHLSQISTQEPSQQFPLMSSIPLQEISSHEHDRITIKDSSSSHVALEDIPQYNNELDEDGDDDDEYDGDLDRTTQPIRRRGILPPQEYAYSDHELEGDIDLDAIKYQPDSESEVEDDSQANFTQGGHVTAARIQRMRDQGLLPHDYEPDSFRVPTDPRQLGLPAWVFDDPSGDEDDDL